MAETQQGAVSQVARIKTAIVTLLVFFTGAAGLVYEVVWQRYLQNLLGSQARATALVLAVFLGGLSLGYFIFGRVARRRTVQSLVRLTGVTEIAIGLWAVCFPSVYESIWRSRHVFAAEYSLPSDLFIACLLLLVPAILMGGTLPLLTQALSWSVEQSSRVHARIYASNTAGAFAGCLAAGFLLLPSLGLSRTLYFTAPLNIGGGLILIVLRFSANVIEGAASKPAARLSTVHFAPLLLAFAAGFCAITLEASFMRIIALTLGSSEYAFSTVVAVFILALAVGAWAIAGRKRIIVPLYLNQLIAGIALLLVYLSVSGWPYYNYLARLILSKYNLSFHQYYGVMFLLLLVVLALPVAAMGSTMPLLFGTLRREQKDLGSLVGRLYGVNALGCVCGALLGGYWLLNFLDLDQIQKLCALLLLLTVLPALFVSSLSRQNAASAALLVCLLASVVFFVLPRWDQSSLNRGIFRESKEFSYSYEGPSEFGRRYMAANKLVAAKDDPNTSVAVYERPAAPQSTELNNGAKIVRNIHVNGKSDGETSPGDMDTMRLSAHLPLLFSMPGAKRAAVVGFGLGVTVGSLTLYPEVEEINCIEISPAVRSMAPYFDFANYNVSRNPLVRWTIDDAYRALGGDDGRYSIIISEPSNPWVVGVERLFSSEFYQVVKDRLVPGGIYAQWVQLYSISEDTLRMVVNTFGSSFAHVRFFEVGWDLIMLGADSPIGSGSLAAMQERYEKLPAVRKALAQVGVPTPEALLARELWLPKEMFAGAVKQTLDFPRLSYWAGRDFYEEVDVNISSYYFRAEVQPWIRKAAPSSLIVLAKSISAEPARQLKEYARASCHLSDVQFFEEWEKRILPCRGALFALGVIGGIPLNRFFPPQGEIIGRLLAKTESSEQWRGILSRLNVEGADTIMEFFSKFDSPFLPLSLDRLREAAGPCFVEQSKAALDCRLKLITVLARTGHGAQAEQALKRLQLEHREALAKKSGIETVKLVAQAVAAER